MRKTHHRTNTRVWSSIKGLEGWIGKDLGRFSSQYLCIPKVLQVSLVRSPLGLFVFVVAVNVAVISIRHQPSAYYIGTSQVTIVNPRCGSSLSAFSSTFHEATRVDSCQSRHIHPSVWCTKSNCRIGKLRQNGMEFMLPILGCSDPEPEVYWRLDRANGHSLHVANLTLREWRVDCDVQLSYKLHL